MCLQITCLNSKSGKAHNQPSFGLSGTCALHMEIGYRWTREIRPLTKRDAFKAYRSAKMDFIDPSEEISWLSEENREILWVRWCAHTLK